MIKKGGEIKTKKIASGLFLALFMMGGIWGLHGFESGNDWGKAVSELAKSEPGAVASHIQMMRM